MKRRGLALLLSAGILTGLLGGCGNASQGNGQESSSQDQGEIQEDTQDGNTDVASQGETITVWLPPYAGADAELTDQEFWDSIFDSFEQENNCTVKVEIVPWDGYGQKIITGLTSGEGPDIVYTDKPYDLIKSGALDSLDNYFTQEELAQYPYYELGIVDDSQYLMPMMVGNAIVLYCNMDILNEAGVEKVPKTWEELLDTAKKIKASGSQAIPFLQAWGRSNAVGTIMTSFLPYYWQAGGEMLDAEGKVNINNEAGLKTLEYLKSFQTEGIFDDTITSVEEVGTLFENGELAMIMDDTGGVRKLNENGIRWEFTDSLIGPGGQKATWVAADALGLASNSKNKELAVKGMKYMLSAPVMDEFHDKFYAMQPVTVDAKYTDDEAFKELYTTNADILHNWPAFENSDSFYDVLYKNIQSMFMGDMEPQQVLDDTMEQYHTIVSVE